MSATTDFVTELWRAANQIEALTVFERRRLIERAVSAIRDMREQIDVSGHLPDQDEALGIIERTGRDIVGSPDELVAHVLFEAADMLRLLSIMHAGLSQ